MTTLHAKSRRHGRVFPLDGHLRDTEQAAVALFGGASRWAESWPRFFRIRPDQRARFLDTLRVAALAHDLGKANDDFQGMVLHTAKRAQALPHEHLSALLLVHPAVRAWLERSAAIDWHVVCAAVLSHHGRATADGGDHQWGQASGTGAVRVRFDDPSLRPILDRMGAIAAVGPLPGAAPSEPFRERGSWADVLRDGQKAAKDFRRAVIGKDPDRTALLLAVKAGLMVADAAASGLVRESREIDGWIGAVVGEPDVTAEEIEAKIIGPRVAVMEKEHRRPFVWAAFQDAASRAPSRALLAGCGSGKTLAAWAWAREQARLHRAGRVVFLYPTRGTSTEGFRDYVAAAPEAALVHGTARYELEQLRNPDDADDGLHPSQAEERLFALRHWGRRFYSATVDQFFAFLQHGFGSTCLLPVLADALVIVDEVHAYDQRMFDQGLIPLLRTFDVPVLCMTATLPEHRIAALQEAGLAVVSAKTLGLDIGSETRPRYRLERATDPLSIVDEAWRAGKRVLWVVNTVRRCQEAARRVAERLPGAERWTYHSRFTLADRTAAHTGTVAAFGGTTARPVIAVTTQVCEMSLDLDADVLVTEVAPCEALVQRFGRCNRKDKADPAFRGRLVVVEPEDDRPYCPKDLAAGRAFLAKLEGLGTDLDQATLARLLAESVPAAEQPKGDAAFLTGGWYAEEQPFRDIEERGVRAVLSSEVDAVLALQADRRPFDGHVLPCPWSLRPTRDDRLPRWLWVVDAATYDRSLGLQEPPKENVA